MALTKTNVVRDTDAGPGSDFATFDDPGSDKHQSMVHSDEDGGALVFGVNYSSAALEDSAAISGATSVGEIMAVLDNPGTATAVCAMVFDAASLPANGTVPLWRIPMSNGGGGYSFPKGLTLATGLVVAFSSTLATLTVTTASEGTFNVRKR